MYQYNYDATGICKYTINNNINNNILDDKYLYTIEENYNNVSNIKNFKIKNIFKEIDKEFTKIEKPIKNVIKKVEKPLVNTIVNNSMVQTSKNLALSIIHLTKDIKDQKSLETIKSGSKKVGTNTVAFAKVAVPIIGSSTTLINDIKNKKSFDQISKDAAYVGIDATMMMAPGGVGIVGKGANMIIKEEATKVLRTAVNRW